MVLAIAGLGVAQDDKAAKKNPFAGDPGALDVGRVLFRMYCGGCHGLHATGGRGGPDLVRGTHANGDTDADMYRVVSNGIPGTPMQSVAGSLDEDNRWRVVSYVRSLAQSVSPPMKGDRAAGEKLFWGKGGCGACHRVGGRGGTIGPDLSRAGRQRSADYLRESVVAPDADITSGYATISVVTRDGKKITGVEKGFDNFSAQFVDLSGNYYSFQKDAVSSLRREYRSLMPSNYGRLFSEGDLDDLLAYLAGLGGER